MSWFDDLRATVEDLYGGYGKQLRSADERAGRFLHETFIDSPTFRKMGEKVEEGFKVEPTDPGRPLGFGDVPYLASPAAPMMFSPEGRAAVRGFGQQAAAEVVKNVTPGDVATLGAMGLGRVAASKGLQTIGKGLSALGDVTAVGAGASDVVSGLTEGEPLRAATGALMATLGAAGRMPGKVEPPQPEYDLAGNIDQVTRGLIEESRQPNVDWPILHRRAQAHRNMVEGLVEPERLTELDRLLEESSTKAGTVASDTLKRITEEKPVVQPPLGYHEGVNEGPGPNYVDAPPYKPRMEYVTQNLATVRERKQPELARVDKPGILDIVSDPTSHTAEHQARAQRAVDYLNSQPAYQAFEGWIKYVHDVARKLIIASPSLPEGRARAVDEAPFSGTYIKTGSRQGSLGYSLQRYARDPVTGGRGKWLGADLNINPLAHIEGILKDLNEYPSFQEALPDEQALSEELLRRVIYTVSHEASHTSSLGHPMKDTFGTEVYDPQSFRYKKGALDPNSPIPPVSGTEVSPHGLEMARAEDTQFEKVVRDVLGGYTKGQFDTIMDSARPHVKGWYDVIRHASEIQRGRAAATASVPSRQPTAEPSGGAVPTGSRAGIPPGGFPGGGGGGRGPIITPPPRKPINWKALPSHGIKEWINARSAAVIHGRAARFRFKNLANETMDWIKRYEAGDRSMPMAHEYEKLMNDMATIEKTVGVPLKERANYIYHLWKDNPDTVRRTFRRLGIRPDFTNQRVHATYEAGIKAGLTPKYDNPLDILAERVRRHKKLVSDKKFYNLLRAKKFIKPANKAPDDWVEIRNFPFHRYTTGKLEHIQVWKARPNIALAINRYLDSPITSPFRDFLQRTAAVATDIKNVVMSSGIPNTAFNMHGFNIARRIAATRDTTTGSLMKAVEMPFRLLGGQKQAGKYVEGQLDEAARFVEAGMRFDIEDHPFKIVEGEVVPPPKLGFWEAVKEERAKRKTFVSKTYGGLRKMHEQLFEDPLFQRALPAWKLQFAIEHEARLIKDGVKRAEATKIAAHQANEVFGGINWVEEGRDPQLQTFLRLALNAPDWAETNLRLAKGAIGWMRNPKDPKFRVYKNIIRNVAVYYLITNALSRMFAGDKKHPAERHFQLRAGQSSSGRTRYIKGAGTAEDWVRLPYEVVVKLSRGDLSGASDIVSARLHPMTQGVINVVKNRNYWGRPLTGEDLPVTTQVGRLTKEFTDVAAPSYVKGPVSALAGESDPEEALMKSIEAPVAYTRPEGPGHVTAPQPRSGRRARRSRTRR